MIDEEEGAAGELGAEDRFKKFIETARTAWKLPSYVLNRDNMTAKAEVLNVWGELVEYQVTLYPGGESVENLSQVLRNFSEPIGNIALMDVIAVAAGVKSAATSIIGMGGAKWLMELFKHTRRKDPVSGVWQKMSEKLNFDIAYQGNFMECFRAFMLVLDVNFFHSLAER